MSTKTIIAMRHSWWVDPAIALLSRYEVIFGKPQHKGILDWIAKHGVSVIYINEIEEKDDSQELKAKRYDYIMDQLRYDIAVTWGIDSRDVEDVIDRQIAHEDAVLAKIEKEKS